MKTTKDHEHLIKAGELKSNSELIKAGELKCNSELIKAGEYISAGESGKVISGTLEEKDNEDN